jgi:hypothetical protein
MKASEKFVLGLGVAYVAYLGTIMWSFWNKCQWAQEKGKVEPLIGDKKLCRMPECFRTSVVRFFIGPAFAIPEVNTAYINADVPLGFIFHEEGHLVWPAAKPPKKHSPRDHMSRKGVRYERQADRYAIDKLMSNPEWGVDEVVNMYDYLNNYNYPGTDIQYRLVLIKRYMRAKYHVEIS